MKKLVFLFAAASLAAATPASAAGTLEGTLGFGGAVSHTGSTAAGSQLDIDLNGGVYVVDSVFAGANLYLRDDDPARTWAITAEGRFHFLDPWLTEEGGALADFSPYVALRLGLASADAKHDDDKGALAAFRLGTDYFLTDNIAIDLFVDAATATGDVFVDKGKLKSSNVRVQLGLSLFF